MYRLMIVDDEPYTVDGLYDLFNELPELDLEIYRAYSAVEAMQYLKRVKLDIVLTDIRMPTMTGLELLQEISRQWPWCKVIFLTGYSDFTYAQQALQHGGHNYLLKTDGDEKIIAAVTRAIAEISAEMENEKVTLAAKHKMKSVLPSLQKEYLGDLLLGGPVLFQTMKKQFEELEMPLDADSLVYPVYGRVDAWWDHIHYSDQSLLLYAIQNITEEYLSPSVAMMCTFLDRSKLLILLHPKSSDIEINNDDMVLVWKRIILFVQETLESIQSTCKKLLNIPISFTASHQPVKWEDLGKKVEDLKMTMMFGFGNESEMILYERIPSGSSNNGEWLRDSLLPEINILESCLISGHEAEFMDAYQRLMSVVGSHSGENKVHRLEVYYKLVTVLLGYMNRRGLSTDDLPEINWGKLLNIESHESWHGGSLFLESLARLLFRNKRADSLDRGSEIIQKVNHYVENNLSKDLSLTQIAEHVYLNPAYLSRLYKQFNGIGLYEYIANLRITKAKELLKQPKYKIHEIAEEIGFDSAYFTRFFKKQTNMTPAEYRNKLLQTSRPFS